MAPEVLIVEDEPKLLGHLEEKMRSEGFSVTTCSNYDSFESILGSGYKAELIVLDRLLNGMDSARLIRRIKENTPDTKIIVLSAVTSSAEKIILLDSGVDDYVSKPFDIDELVARMRAVLRRNSKELVCGNVTLDLEKRVVRVNEKELVLQNREFILLKTLVRIPGKVFNKRYLYEYVWDISVEAESNVVEATINKLRRRLEEAAAGLQIKSMRNKGYWVEE